MDNVFLNKSADCIGGGSTFDRADRLVMASKILAVLRPSGAAIEATSFQMLMDAYMRGYAWRAENPDSDEFLPKAAYDYSDKTMGAHSDDDLAGLLRQCVNAMEMQGLGRLNESLITEVREALVKW